MTRAMNALIAILIVVGLFATTNASANESSTSRLIHSWYNPQTAVYATLIETSYSDGSKEVYSAVVGNFTNVDLLPDVDQPITVTARLADSVTFTQRGIDYSAKSFENLNYNGYLNNQRYAVDNNGGECNLFDLSVVETNEVMQVCLDPTDNPNATNGAVALLFNYIRRISSQIGTLDQGIKRYAIFPAMGMSANDQATIKYAYYDRDTNTYTGMLYSTRQAVGFTMQTSDLPNLEESVTITTQSATTVVFIQNGIEYNATVKELTYGVYLDNMRYAKDSNGGECNIFDMTIIETSDIVQVCLDPTDVVNAHEGRADVRFDSTTRIGTMVQDGHTYPLFNVTVDMQPAKQHKVYIALGIGN